MLHIEQMKKAFFLSLLAIFWLSPVAVHSTSSSSNYSISDSVIASGGGALSSSSYNVQSVVGQSTVAGMTASTNYSLYAGILSIPDSDGDGVLDNVDNCINDSNPTQLDSDGDGQGNVCDLDDDNDGLSDVLEGILGTDPLLSDSDADGLSDFDEVNADGDPNTYQPGVDTDPNNSDTDGDGLLDGADPDPLSAAPDGDLAPWDNPDGQINGADVLIATQLVLGQRTAGALQLEHGDMNRDGVIDLADLLLIQQVVLE